MRVSAKKANSTTTDVVLEVRMSEEEARDLFVCPRGAGLVTLNEALGRNLRASIVRDVLEEHLKTRFRVSRVVPSL